MSDDDVRIGRFIKDGKEQFLSFHLYNDLHGCKDVISDEQLAVFEALNDDLPGMIDSIVPADGYTFEKEDGSILYEEDAWLAFQGARSIWLDLTLGGEYGNVKTIMKDGVQFRPYDPYSVFKYRTEDDIRAAMLGYFDEQLADKVLSDLSSAGRLFSQNNTAYVRSDVIQDKGRYGAYTIDSMEQSDAEHAVLHMHLQKAVSGDELYSYSSEEIIDFDMVKNSSGRWVFTSFPYWDSDYKA